MLFTFNKKSGSISLLDQTSFKEEAILERKHIEAWVEEHPEILGEELLIISTEFDKFDKTKERLDLLALDKESKVVIIELKRDDSGKNVDLQAIKYAAYCSTMTIDDIIDARNNYLKSKNIDSSLQKVKDEIIEFVDSNDIDELDDKPRIIIVSRTFRPEVMASILWLRNFGVDISCVTLKPYNLSENEIGITANKIIPLKEAEDYQMRVEQKEISESRKSKIGSKYIKVWQDIYDTFNCPENLELKTPNQKGYYQIASGKSNIHYEFYYQGRGKKFGVELHFENSNRDKNIDILKSLESKFSDFEKNTKGTFFIQEKWGKKWSRLGTQIEKLDFGKNDLSFAKTEMDLLIKTFQSTLKKYRS